MEELVKEAARLLYVSDSNVTMNLWPITALGGVFVMCKYMMVLCCFVFTNSFVVVSIVSAFFFVLCGVVLCCVLKLRTIIELTDHFSIVYFCQTFGILGCGVVLCLTLTLCGGIVFLLVFWWLCSLWCF